MIIGFLTSFLFVFLLAIGIFCFGYACRNETTINVLWTSTWLTLAFLSLILIFIENSSPIDLIHLPNNSNWIWLIAASFCSYVAGNYFSYLNLKTAGESINALLAPAITALSVIASYFLLSERFRILSFIGIIITLFSVTYFLIKRINYSHQMRIGSISGLICIILMAISIICAVKGAAGMSFLHAVWVQFFVGALLIWPLKIYKGFSSNIINKRKYYLVITTGVLLQNVVAGYLWYFSTFRIGVSIFQSIIATLPFCVYAIDVFVFKNSSPSRLFFITCSLALTGISLMAFG
jgi:drug/metabolite transporter (DMT)-like permease